jgi:hypothetical protein
MKILNYNYGEIGDLKLLLKNIENLSIDTPINDQTDTKTLYDIRTSWHEKYDSLLIGIIHSGTKYINRFPIIICKSKEQYLFISTYTI